MLQKYVVWLVSTPDHADVGRMNSIKLDIYSQSLDTFSGVMLHYEENQSAFCGIR